ncbi:MAG: amino acid racemase [Bacteroidetes bacterium]|nr:amino acid racemase [Bacteroidota bacterium]
MKRPTKTLGVLGGMGPAATAEFMRLLACLAPADVDQEHPEVIVYNHTATPDRTTHILGKGPDPMPQLRVGIAKLVEWGSDVLVVTCNTAHYFLDQIRSQIPVPLIHIVEETIRQAQKLSPRGAWLTSTLGTAQTGLYQKHSALMGYSFHYPTQLEQADIHDITDQVKAGDTQKAGERYRQVIRMLQKRADLPIVGACTELPLAYRYTGMEEGRFISCLESLAKGAIQYLYAL